MIQLGGTVCVLHCMVLCGTAAHGTALCDTALCAAALRGPA